MADLWTSDAVEGRWYDDDGRVFTCATLAWAFPDVADNTETRTVYYGSRSSLVERGKRNRPPREAPRLEMDALSPVPLAEEPFAPHQIPHGLRALSFWEGTNETALVAAYRPEGVEEPWRLVTWDLVEDDDPEQKREELIDWITEKVREGVHERGTAASAPPVLPDSERELLRRDVRHDVAAYRDWHCTDGRDFEVIDDLPRNRDFIRTLTNELASARLDYARVMPGPFPGTNGLPVVRLYGTREEYLMAAGTNMAWTAAHWAPARREIVAYLPDDGEGQLLETLRHECFHQYLSYATGMITASPWLNEGYAEFFEGRLSGMEMKRELMALGVGSESFSWDQAAAYLPSLLGMGYEAFYAEPRLNYPLAKSIAHFLEYGAPRVRFEPFRNLKRDYLKTLVETQDMLKATSAAFATKENLYLFTKEWQKYYENM